MSNTGDDGLKCADRWKTYRGEKAMVDGSVLDGDAARQSLMGDGAPIQTFFHNLQAVDGSGA